MVGILAMVIGCMLAACSSESGSDPDGGMDAGSDAGAGTVIRAAGGEVVSSDGLVTLKFPENAVTQDTAVSVQKVGAADLPPEIASIKGASVTYEMKPAGATFQKAVDVEITMQNMESPDGHKTTTVPGMVAMTYSDTNGYEPIGKSFGTPSQEQKIFFDATTKRVWIKGTVEHFSYLTIVESGMRISLSPIPDEIAPGEQFGSQLVLRNARTPGTDVPAYEIRGVTPVADGTFTPMGGGPGADPDPVRPWLTAGQFDHLGRSEIVEDYVFASGMTDGTGGYGVRIDYTVQPSPMTDFAGMEGTFGPALDEVGTRSLLGVDGTLVVQHQNRTVFSGAPPPQACCFADGCEMLDSAECGNAGGTIPMVTDQAFCSDCQGVCCEGDTCTADVSPSMCTGTPFNASACTEVTCGKPVHDACVTPAFGPLMTLVAIMQATRTVACGNALALALQNIIHSAVAVPSKPVANDHTTLMGVSLFSQTWTQALADLLFNMSEFDCGTGVNSFTVCPTTPDTFPAGGVVLVATALRTPVPLTDGTNTYQYGFVFETDGSAANDYAPSADFANDFFQDTDVWFEANYDPTNGWSLKKTIPSMSFDAQPTAARIIIEDNVMLLAVPASELNNNTAPQYRVSAFRHTGDFGINAPHDYDGSLWPAVADGLATP